MQADLTLFAHVARRPEAELDLGQAALLVAAADGREVDVARFVEELDRLGAQAAERIDTPPRNDAENGAALEKILSFLYGELGFRGNDSDYYDPRNSYLDEVLTRRTGIPITLAVVLLEVARRAGVSARGVSFPGHFLVRAPSARGPLFVDPFAGAVVGDAGLKALFARATGEDRDPDPRLLEPCDKQQILVRMLNNLRGIWSARHDEERLSSVERRIAVLTRGTPPRGGTLMS